MEKEGKQLTGVQGAVGGGIGYEIGFVTDDNDEEPSILR